MTFLMILGYIFFVLLLVSLFVKPESFPAIDRARLIILLVIIVILLYGVFGNPVSGDRPVRHGSTQPHYLTA